MTFTVGINLPWIDDQYDHDFGYNMTRKEDVSYDPKPTFSKQNFERYIKDISEMGVKVVRLWLFERFEGLQFSHGGYVLNPTTDMFMNLREACIIAKKYDVKFYFCLMDTWGILSDDLKDSINGDPRKKYAAIINGLITTKDKRETFLQAAVDILSEKIISESVWAVDVINEPDGILRDRSMKDPSNGNIDTGITFDHLIEYINDACNTIKSKTGHRVSCGIQREVFEQFTNRIKNSVDFFDIHHYDNEGVLPSISHLRKEYIVGECGQGDRNEKNDSKQKTAIKKFLENSKNFGYSGCFVWEYGFKGGDNPLALINSDETHRPAINEIKEFLKNV
ncbi:MAG: hypothetical protein HRU07_03320 [Nitrosopumilus sp.]|nr:hypothetical protein [Nitrosopumilus sp.]NRA05191.1 hypothetical protein [Nitrosopumilus sp.]